MRLSPLTRSALVLIPLLICAGRLHAQRAETMQGMTQEVNRCLTMVRVASSRRRRNRSVADLERVDVLQASAADRPRAGRQRTMELAKSA